MNLDRALVLLLASIGAVAGFTPSGRVAFSVASSQSARVASVPNVRVASALSSEVEQAAEAAAAPAFDTAIHVGNISFGEIHFVWSCLMEPPPPPPCHSPCCLCSCSTLILLLVRLLKS